jgi:hypothetical protein
MAEGWNSEYSKERRNNKEKSMCKDSEIRTINRGEQTVEK